MRLHSARELKGLTYHIGHQVSVKVGGDHDVKLVWSGDKLHACVVNNHLLSLHTNEGGVPSAKRHKDSMKHTEWKTGDNHTGSACQGKLQDLHRLVRPRWVTLMEGYFCATLLNSCREHSLSALCLMTEHCWKAGRC